MTTVTQIIDAAYATSKANRPGSIGTEGTEYVQFIQRCLGRYFADAVEHNRMYYAAKYSISWDVTLLGWLIPDRVESVIRIEMLDGTEVAEVPIDDKKAELSKPAVYLVGRTFHSAGFAKDPLGVALSFYCSRLPGLLLDTTSLIDPLWPEQFNSLLIFDLAIHLAHKDGRSEEIALLQDQYNREYESYINFLTHVTTTLVRRYEHRGKIATKATVP